MDGRKVVPTGTNVLVVQYRTKKTASGIILADESQERSQEAEVVAVGQAAEGVNIGDKVLLDIADGVEIEDNGDEVWSIVDCSDIIAVVEP